MAIFGILELEAKVQEDEKTRLDATKSYITPGEAAITLVEIESEAAAGFIDVTSLQYLDWNFTTAATKTVTLRITTDGAPVTFTRDIVVVTAAVERLFSKDSDIRFHEPDILKWIPSGKADFRFVHRRAQDRIIAWLDEKRYWGTDGERLTLDEIVDLQEFKEWSTFMALRLIFQGNSNAVDDVFAIKAKRYNNLEVSARNRGTLRLDKNRDGELSQGERQDVWTHRLTRG